jgi:hypothetical protein
MSEEIKFLSLDDLLNGDTSPPAKVFYLDKMKTLFVTIRDCSHYSDYVDNRLSILRDNETKEIVGIELFLEDPPIVHL